jgi:uncharacterized protein YdeI (YjbR/CyaY-like superfamily)
LELSRIRVRREGSNGSLADVELIEFLAMEPTFFKTPAEFRRWLRTNHTKATELWLAFYKKDSGKKGITYQEALDEALCHGWIDGIRKTHDDEAFKIRFSPRKPRSIWSAINIKRVGELTEAGRMQKNGLAVFSVRKDEPGYSIVNAPKELPPDLQKIFKQNKKAWEFHLAQPPGYRKMLAFWISFAKREETRLKRLRIIIEFAEKGQRVPRD